MCFVFTAEGEKGKKTSQIQIKGTHVNVFPNKKIKPQNEKFAHVFKQGFRSYTEKPKQGNLIRQEKKNLFHHLLNHLNKKNSV